MQRNRLENSRDLVRNREEKIDKNCEKWRKTFLEKNLVKNGKNYMVDTQTAADTRPDGRASTRLGQGWLGPPPCGLCVCGALQLEGGWMEAWGKAKNHTNAHCTSVEICWDRSSESGQSDSESRAVRVGRGAARRGVTPRASRLGQNQRLATRRLARLGSLTLSTVRGRFQHG